MLVNLFTQGLSKLKPPTLSSLHVTLQRQTYFGIKVLALYPADI